MRYGGRAGVRPVWMGPLWCDCSQPFTPALNGPDKRFDGHFHTFLPSFLPSPQGIYWTFADCAHSSVAVMIFVQPGLSHGT
jgi:hypothetical protein